MTTIWHLGVLKTFKKQLRQLIFDYLELTDFDKFIAINGIEREIEKINSIEIENSTFDKYCRGSEELKRMFRVSYQKALQKTEAITYQAMEALIHNLSTMHGGAGAQVPFSTVNFGTDTSKEGRMVTQKFLEAIEAGLGNHETAIFPVSIFKVKEGINYQKQDPNYDLFELACKVSSKALFPNFSFLDATFNKKFYQKGNCATEVAYTGCRTRVIDNIVDENKTIVTGRGNLCTTTINLPRLGIKHGIVSNPKAQLEDFFTELEEKLDLVKDQLLERFEVGCKKKVYNFPFLFGQGVWMDSEKLKPTDSVKKALKHGSLAISFIGLAECLKALTGKHHAESEEAQKLGIKIIKFMRKKCEEYSKKYNLNFVLFATSAKQLSGRFNKMDQAIFGKLKGITDKECYTNSFHLPNNYKISAENKIKIEAPYHALTNGGHITYVKLGKEADNLQEFMKIIQIMKEQGIGYGAINTSTDMDPVCSFIGDIFSICPGCGRHEESVKFEKKIEKK